jgi:uncharacterized Ntn-hydrolase superfamily protein
MTFSIVAYDPDESAWGVAVASKFPAVGAVVPWAQAGVGAIATQAFANTSFGPHGLELMASGLSASEALEKLLSDDPERETRQVGMVDAQGAAVTFTGEECFEWAGGLSDRGYAIQGNILTGEETIKAMQKAFLESKGHLPSRLYAALQDGDRAGGDRRGRQSAAIYAVKPKGGYGGYLDRWFDYRVDDHTDTVARLGELLELHELYFGESPKGERLKLSGASLKQLQEIMAKLGYLQEKSNGQYDQATQEALRAFTGNENFEERCNIEAGWIDRPVLEYLLRKFGN